jgi:phosphatidate cytidylyltransferase
MPALLSLVACFAVYVISAQRGAPWVMPALGTIMVLAISLTLVRPTRPEQVLTKGRIWLDAFLYPFLPLAGGLMFTYPSYDYSFVLLPVILIWINDVMAYVIGRQWGRRKIAPHISPGKTVEGTLGAALFTIIAGLFIATWFPDVPRRYALALGILVPFLALTGDLWESAVKRQAGVKDSGDLLPGHGGVLDRYDSFVFVLPVAALLYYIFAA